MSSVSSPKEGARPVRRLFPKPPIPLAWHTCPLPGESSGWHRDPGSDQTIIIVGVVRREVEAVSG